MQPELKNNFISTVLDNYKKKLAKKLRTHRKKTVKNYTKKEYYLLVQNQDKILEPINSYLRDINNYKINTILKATEDLVHEKLNKNPELIISITVKMLSQISEYTDLQISACPTQAKILQDRLQDLTSASSSLRNIRILQDQNFAPGSILIKAHKSIIDGRLETRLNQARLAMQNIGHKC